MSHVGELLPERVARERLRRRQRAEAERRERVFNDKVRTIGIDKEALDVQIIEKKKAEDAAEKEQKAHDAETLQTSRVLTLLHRRQEKEKRAMEKAVVSYRHECQRPRERDLGDPEPGHGPTVLPGLTGEDLQCETRRQKQKDQLRRWLTQQQAQRTAQRRQQELEDQLHDLRRAEMDNKALELQSVEVRTRAAAAVATKEHNLAATAAPAGRAANPPAPSANAKMEEKRQQRRTEGLAEASPSRVGVPGLREERSASPERLQQVLQFQKRQVEEKQRREVEVRREEERHDRLRLDSARAALLLERQQARLSQQLRRRLDRTNVQLAQEQRQQSVNRRSAVERGSVEDGFFSQFNTCSR
uniref:RIB43A domain with coiled-coils 2 n=1 Tax=Tetraodon nigroviridis TaxID=99883 RepID=H3C256_TETNG